MIDLDRVQQIINRPHIIDLRDDGWTLMHPPACHPRLFECSANQAAVAALTERPPQAPGRYEVALYGHDDSGEVVFVIGKPAADPEGVDWTALVAELRAAQKAHDRIIRAVDKFERDLAFTAPELTSMRIGLLREAIEDAFLPEDDGEVRDDG